VNRERLTRVVSVRGPSGLRFGPISSPFDKWRAASVHASLWSDAMVVADAASAWVWNTYLPSDEVMPMSERLTRVVLLFTMQRRRAQLRGTLRFV
jgi:hypothetical protein